MRRTVRTCVAACGVMAAMIPIGISLASVTLAAQAAGPACIAIVLPVVQGVPGSAVDAAAGVRDLMSAYLTGPKLKVIPLEARLQSQAVEEAKEKHCEPLLFVTVTHKAPGKGLLKALGQGAGVASVFVPGGGTIAAAAARTATAAGLQTASALAASTKAKDQVRLEYQLQSASGQVQFGPKTEEQTASIDGEDLLTPVVTRAAEAIVTRKSAN